MRVLLDTHVLIWAVADPEKLPAPIRDLVSNPATDVLVSTASAWEIAIKVARGRLEFSPITADLLNHFGFRLHPIDLRHTQALTTLPEHHRDPFDRMLVAQAAVDDVPLVSGDAALSAYPVQVLW